MQPTNTTSKLPTRSEHDEQVAVFNWIRLNDSRFPGLSLAFAIPNGGKRNKATAGRLKAEGVMAGVPDILIPVARNEYHGLFVEMKVRGRHPTPLQLNCMAGLAEQGYLCAICYSVDQFSEIIKDYYS